MLVMKSTSWLVEWRAVGKGFRGSERGARGATCTCAGGVVLLHVAFEQWLLRARLLKLDQAFTS